MKSFGFHREAEAEFLEALRHYAEVSPGIARRFYDEIDRLIVEICRSPQLFRKFAPPARRHFSRTFPYAAIYLDQTDRIWVVAAMHFKRPADYWKTRV